MDALDLSNQNALRTKRTIVRMYRSADPWTNDPSEPLPRSEGKTR